MNISTRPITAEDQKRIANLIHFEVFVHRHLDWRPPLDWFGYQPFLVAEYQGEIVASLACPPDQPEVTWIRMFVVTSKVPVEIGWNILWDHALSMLKTDFGINRVAAIPSHAWFQSLLGKSGFHQSHRVIMFCREHGILPPKKNHLSISIRSMTIEDLHLIHEIDKQSFNPVWQNSRGTLELAFKQAAFATVAVCEDRVIGYQISTNTPIGGHLARLAVIPQFQRKGVGYAILRDLLDKFERRGARSITVNTQHDNLPSLALYKKAGFHITCEEYPIFEYIPK